MPTLPNTHKIEVTGLTEVEAGRLSSRLLWMKATGLLSGKVRIRERDTNCCHSQDGSRVSTYGGL